MYNINTIYEGTKRSPKAREKNEKDSKSVSFESNKKKIME
jgi:hypothetical protein